MKPKLKLPGTKRLRRKCDILLSTFAFKFNLRRYIKGLVMEYLAPGEWKSLGGPPNFNTVTRDKYPLGMRRSAAEIVAVARGIAAAGAALHATGIMHGRAVQVDPINSKLKPPGTELLKLYYDELLSRFGFKFYLRRFSTGTCTRTT
jgi:hypothetical protein